MKQFVLDKWGDLIGWELLHLGVAVSVWGALVGNKDLFIIGAGLTNAGFIALKLKTSEKPAPAAPPAGGAPCP